MSKIIVTQKDNDKYFKQKLSTWTHGFCEINRQVTLVPDPNGVYATGEYGYITAGGKKLVVVGNADHGYEIAGREYVVFAQQSICPEMTILL